MILVGEVVNRHGRRAASGGRLQEQTRNWNRMTDIIDGVLKTAPEEL